MTETEAEAIIDTTRHWLKRAVIGLNLCPFAKSVYIKDQVRYAVSASTEEGDVLADLETELLYLLEIDATRTDTTLLIIPSALKDFFEFSYFLRRTQQVLKRTRLTGLFQIASFHPQYQFAGSEPDDIENYTNRAPYPILQILREQSVERAVHAFPDAAGIYERNIETLGQMGISGWTEWMNHTGDDNT